MAYWWCTEHRAVEPDGGCRAEVRLGPYPTAEAAQGALSAVQERNDKLDAEDQAWRDGS